MRWLYSLLAFIFVSLFVSSVTFPIFLNTAIDTTDIAKQTFKEKNAAIVQQQLDEVYSKMTSEQKASFDQIESLTVEQRQTMLANQCNDPKYKEQPFCNPDFLSGKLKLSDVFRQKLNSDLEYSESIAVNELKNKLLGYQSYPTTVIAVLSGILAVFFYSLKNGFLKGLQTFLGNSSWLSALSGFSFKLMPKSIDMLFAAAQQNLQAENSQAALMMKDVVLAWLVPAMNAAMMMSFYIAIGAFVVWATLKLFRSYTISTE